MQVTLENLSGLERKLKIVIPAERVANEVQKKMHKVAATAKIPGFRAGKVPLVVAQKHYGGAVRKDILADLINETCMQAVRQEKLDPVAFPRIEIVSAKPQESFCYNAVFEIYPKIDLTDLNKVQVEKMVAKVTDDDVNTRLEEWRKIHGQWEKIVEPSRKSQVGDQLIIDFTCKVIDAAGKTETEKNFDFVLGNGSMWSDFENQLYGVSVGEKKQCTLRFPETHMDKDLAGKNAEFIVEIREVNAPILPPLDDELAKKISSVADGLADLKSEIYAAMESELQGVLEDLFKNAIFSKLLESKPIEIPKVLVAEELDRFAKVWQKHVTAKQKTTNKIPPFPRETFVKKANCNVSLGLLLATIVKEKQIEVAQQELQTKVENLVAYHHDTKKAVQQYFSDAKRLAKVKSDLLEEKVFKYLAANFVVVEKAIDYKDAIKASKSLEQQI